LIQFDIAEEIRLETVREFLGLPARERGPEFHRPSPEYVRFAQPPVIFNLGPVQLRGGETWSCTLKVYDYGVIGLALELPFEDGWRGLVQLASRWIGSPEIEQKASETARAAVARFQKALVKPNEDWTSEDYYAVHVRRACENNASLSAEELISNYAGPVTQIVRGESVELSAIERHEVLEEFLSYYPTDLLVVGWMAAFIYDEPPAAAPVLQLLEYANTQLLEFRYYDSRLTGVLAHVHAILERRRGVFGRWRIGSEAERLNRIRLDVIELSERVDNAIKFLSDMFYARVYRLAARKIGVNDYRDLVDEKLKTAGEVYEAMVGEFHQARAFVLELMVVAILIIELVFLFRGKG
jgi:hypothetical protein